MSASFINLKRSAIEQSRRKLSQIDLMIREFSEHAAELDEVVETEEARVGIFDPKHFAYPCYAKAVAQRRDNLRSSIEDLKQQLQKVRPVYEDALAESMKIEFDAPHHQVGDGCESVSSPA